MLAWSRDPQVGPWLREWAGRRVPMARRAHGAAGAPAAAPAARSRRTCPTARFCVRCAATRRPETESVPAAGRPRLGPDVPRRRRRQPGLVGAAAGGRGPPAATRARRDPNAEVRQAARAALARLGERQALQWFRQALTGEDPQRVHEAVQLAASEGLTLLWPDLDRLADAEDTDVAHHAREALERLCEDLPGRRR